MKNKRLKSLFASLVVYLIGALLYKGSNGNLALIIPGALLMLAGLVLNVIFMIGIFKDVFFKKR
jgi:hypothetical protein